MKKGDRALHPVPRLFMCYPPGWCVMAPGAWRKRSLRLLESRKLLVADKAELGHF
jgi:hypothetical protein